MSVPLIGADIDGTVVSVTVLQVPPANQGVLSYTRAGGQVVEITPNTTLSAAEAETVTFTPAPDFNGAVSDIQFSTTDDDGAISAPATVEITVNDVNDAPVATDGAISTAEGTAIAVPLIASDIDGVVASITITTLPDPAQGVLSYTNAAGDSVPVVAGTPLSAAEAATVLFTPTENFNGAVEAIDFIATDDDGLDSASATVTVNVTDVNTPPTADDQSLTTDEDTAVSVPLIGADIDGTVVSVTVLQVPPANQGVLSYEDNGQTVELTPGTVLTADQITSVMFTPAPNFNGRVSNIQFSTTDDDGAISAPATVEITVNDVNDAPVATDGAISTAEGTAIAVPLIASDIDGVVASITITTLPDAAQGVLSYTNAAGDSVPVVAGTPLSAAEAATVLFTPTENFNGAVEAIDFIATDDDGLDSASATVTVNVTDVNTPPTADDQSLTTDEDTAVSVPLIGADIDGTVVSVTVLQVPPANQGVLSYTRAGGQVVEITPNTTLSAAEAETVTFTPAPDFNGAVSDIQFSTTDDDGAISAPATVEITVNDVNDAPVATDGAISTAEGTAIAVPLIASDIDGVVASITITTLPDPAQGVLSYTNAAGDSVPVVAGTPLSAAEAATVLFTPTENFNGAVEAIDFIATDDDGLDSASATVTVNVTDVNTPPTADDQSLTTDEDTAVSVPLIGADIDGTVVSVTVLQVPPANQGVLSYEDNGQTVELTPGTVLTADQITSVMFTPAPNFNGRVSNIQFSTTDDDGAISAPATVEITVNDVNDAPVATDGAISTPEGTAIAVPLIASDIDGVVASITITTLPDPAQGVLSYTNAAGDSVPVVAGTPLSAAEAATVLFTPTENFNGAVEAIDFIATDDDGLDSASATVTVNVTDVNTPPTADDQSLTTDEDTAVSVPLIGADIDGTVVSVTVLQVPPANQGGTELYPCRWTSG
ncbi:tandem-95 repeat protein [Psychrobacter sp. ER1]|uniref:tandem-95 repeat protein n=1 Tax=Psychrobacter sp. ER1 TaxID=3406645 RepID=UPI003B43A862